MLMVTQHAGFGVGGTAVATLSPTNLEFYLRANNLASYDTGIDGQKWRNMHTAPTSGASQGAYDLWRGADNTATTDDPTFNGVQGAGNSTNYWSFDGGNYFKSLTMPAFIKGLHKAGATYTIGLLIRTPASFSNCRLFSTCSTSNWIGFELQMSSAGGISPQVIRDTGGSLALIRNSSALSPSTVYALVLSIKQGIGSYLRANKSYLNCDGAATWDGTYSTPSSSDPVSTAFGIGAMPEGTSPVTTGTRLHSIAMYNGWMSEAAADTLADAMLTDAGNP